MIGVISVLNFLQVDTIFVSFDYVQVENLPPPPPLPSPIKPLKLTEYEQLKTANIVRNNEKLRELNLPTLVTDVVDGLKKTEEKKRCEMKMNMFQKMRNKVMMMLQKLCQRCVVTRELICS